MSGHHANIVNMLIDRKTHSSLDNKAQRRLFDVYAETKSVKDFTQEDVQFMYPEIVKSTITIEFQNEGHIFASTHGDHTVKIVDFATGKILRTLIGHPRTPWAVKFHPRNPDILVSGCIGSTVIVWNWKKNETIAYTQIMQNVMISSLDWHPKEEMILVTCGTTVYIWDYMKNALINLFPTSVRKYQFAFFYGDGKDFIASHENVINRGQYKTYTISKYQLIKDKYTQATVVYGCSDISTQSTVNCSNGIHISKNGDYAIISVCEGPRNVHYNASTVPDIPSASLLQLQRSTPFSLPPNPPSLPPLPPLPPSQPSSTLPTNIMLRDINTQTTNSHISIFHGVDTTRPTTPLRDGNAVPRSSLVTPPRQEPEHQNLVTPPLPRQVNIPSTEESRLPRPRELGVIPPAEPTLRPLAMPTFQQLQIQGRQQPLMYPRFIAKVSLVGNSVGKVVSKYKIPDNAMVASLQISPSNDFILASYRIRNVEREGSFKSIFFHIYRQMDWRLYYESLGTNDNANIATWSPRMDGLVVGTEKGKLIIFRANVCPLSRQRQVKEDEESFVC